MKQKQQKKNSMRIQRFIALNSAYSRRTAEKLIDEGSVKLNGKIVTEQGVKVEPGDSVKVNNKLIQAAKETVTIMLNKPAGYVTTKKDELDRKTVMDLIPYKDLVPVGRLDKDTEGLLLFTNDGDLAYNLTHPKFEHEKEYEVRLRDPLSIEDKEKLEQGVRFDGRRTAPSRITKLKGKECNITIHEGRKRQIRRMFEVVGNKVIYLKRIRIGKVKLGNLQKGNFKIINNVN
ncbi:pseudouridine synthase [Patescibacteria group bacterium]